MSGILAAALLPLALLVGALVAWRTLARPVLGLYLLALLAPVSNLIAIGPVRAVYLLSLLVLCGVALRLSVSEDFGVPRPIAFNAVVFLALMTYAWLLGAAEATQQYVGFVGSLALVVALLLLRLRVEHIRTWLWLFGLGMAVADIAFAVLVLSAPALRMTLLDIASEGVRLQGLMGNPNVFGGAQVLAVTALAFTAIEDPRRRRRIIAWPALGVAFGALLLSQSRSAILGILLAAALVGALYLARVSRHRVRLVVAGAAACAVLALVFVNLPPEIGGFRLGRVAASDEADSRRLLDVGGANVGEDRIYLYAAAIRTIARFPHGLGYQADPETIIGRVAGTYKNPHNFLLTEILNYGVAGGLYVILLWVVPPLFIMRELWLGRLREGSVSTFILVGMIAYLIHALFHSLTNWVYLWIFWGLGIRAVQIERLRPDPVPEGRHVVAAAP